MNEAQVARMQEMTASSVELVNHLLTPYAAAIDADPSGPEAAALVAVFNAYSHLLSENLSLDSLKLSAKLTSVLVAELKKAGG